VRAAQLCATLEFVRRGLLEQAAKRDVLVPAEPVGGGDDLPQRVANRVVEVDQGPIGTRHRAKSVRGRPQRLGEIEVRADHLGEREGRRVGDPRGPGR